MEKKTERLLFRVGRLERELFTRAAERSGLSLSEWMRERLLVMAEREVGGIPVASPF